MGENRGDDLTGDGGLFRVLMNGEEQYSLWLAVKAIPGGWRSIHGPDSKAACVAHVEANWTDMRPKSLRQAMGD